MPIYALTSETATRYRVSLFRDVFPLMISYHGHDREALLEEAERTLLAHRVVDNGDIIVVSFGEPIGVSGGTNTLKIVKIGENRRP